MRVKSNNDGERNWWRYVMVLCSMALTCLSVNAVEVTVRAGFKTSPEGGERRFTITTPVSGTCVEAKQLCRQQESSILLPQLRAALDPPPHEGGGPPSLLAHRFRPRTPGTVATRLPQEKKVMVTHASSGASYPVTFTPLLLDARLQNKTGSAFFAYRSPTRETTCWTMRSGSCQDYPMNGPGLRWADQFSFVYRLDAPDPQTMMAGEYSARIEYSTGAGQEWDFGPHFKFSDNRVVINLILTVVADIAVEPIGEQRVILSPPGGWNRWGVDNRDNAPAIRYDLPFYLSSSAPFRIYLEESEEFCGRRCVLVHHGFMPNHAPFSASITLDVGVTLPSVDIEAGGGPVQNLRLRVGAGTAPTLVPRHRLFRQRGLLHFGVTAERVGYMLRHRGGIYRSELRVIFDAAL